MKKITALLILSLSALQAECIDFNGVKLNTETSLMWSTPASTAMTWIDAQTYCSSLVEGGYSNWMLPNINQLESERVDFGGTAVCFTPNLEWSTTEKDSTTAFVMEAAHVQTQDKSLLSPIRCVRAN